MRGCARRSALTVLLLLAMAEATLAGWPMLRTRRQVAVTRPPAVTPPTPTVSLGTVPRYPWGYFGAYSDPHHVYHRGYYGDYFDWSFRTGP